jgi:uncharacterized repeat protein (TIGR01451 family)
MVDYATRDITATEGIDYVREFGVAIFRPGDTNREVRVTIKGDLVNEADETFWLMLANPVNARLLRDHAVGTIMNDDALPALSIRDAAIRADSPGESSALFAVNLFPASGQTVTVDYLTRSATALPGSDFVPIADTLTFVPGVTARTVAVPLSTDRGATEVAPQTFFVTLTNARNAEITRSSGVATLIRPEELATAAPTREKKPSAKAASSPTTPVPSNATAPVQLQPSHTSDLSALWSAPAITLRSVEAYRQTSRASVAQPPPRIADVRLELVGSTNFTHVEQDLIIKLTVTNAGPETAQNVVVINRLPPSATFLLADASQGTYTRSGGVVSFNLGDLAAGSKAAAAIALKFSAAGAATNLAQVGWNNAGSNPKNNSAELAVYAANDLPVIASIADQTTTANTPTRRIAVSVSDTETPAENVLLVGSSSNTRLVPDENLVFGGTGSHRTLAITPAQNQSGTAVITVAAVDSDGGETTKSFNVEVAAASPEGLSIERIARVPNAPRIEQIERAGDLFKFSFNAEAGLAYAVEYTESATTDQWQTLTNIAPLSAATGVEITDSVTSHEQRFYRLKAFIPSDAAHAVAARIDLHFTAKPGVRYLIEYSNSLESDNWHALSSFGPITATSAVTISDFGTDQSQRFYRLRPQF